MFLIENGLHEPLLSIANKLLAKQHLNFDQLTPPEQKMWNLFEKSGHLQISHWRKRDSAQISPQLPLICSNP